MPWTEACLIRHCSCSEGRGGDIRHNFFAKHAPKQYRGTFFILASNRLPDMAEKPARPSAAHDEQWLPLASRAEIVMLRESFAGKTK